MKELEYPFDPEWILKKKKALKRELLQNTKQTIPELASSLILRDGEVMQVEEKEKKHGE